MISISKTKNKLKKATLVNKRFDFSTIESYFGNLRDVLREHKYPPSTIYKVDETVFSITSRTTC